MEATLGVLALAMVKALAELALAMDRALVEDMAAVALESDQAPMEVMPMDALQATKVGFPEPVYCSALSWKFMSTYTHLLCSLVIIVT